MHWRDRTAVKPKPIEQYGVRALVLTLTTLSAAPMLEIAVSPDNYLPLALEAISSTSVGVMLSLSVWVGLGPQSLLKRLFGGIVGAGYISFWPELAAKVQSASTPPGFAPPWEEHATSALGSMAMSAFFSAVFLTLGRWWKLGPTPAHVALMADKSQFSLFAILLLTAASAVVMGGVRASRTTVVSLNPMDGTTVTVVIVVLSLFAANAVGTVFATLSRWRPHQPDTYYAFMRRVITEEFRR